jgi:hypothetical protein
VRSSSRRPSPLDLETDRRLRAAHGLGGPGKTVQVGYQDEGLDRLDIERLHRQPFKFYIIEMLFHGIFQ